MTCVMPAYSLLSSIPWSSRSWSHHHNHHHCHVECFSRLVDHWQVCPPRWKHWQGWTSHPYWTNIRCRWWFWSFVWKMSVLWSKLWSALPMLIQVHENGMMMKIMTMIIRRVNQKADGLRWEWNNIHISFSEIFTFCMTPHLCAVIPKAEKPDFFCGFSISSEVHWWHCLLSINQLLYHLLHLQIVQSCRDQRTKIIWRPYCQAPIDFVSHLNLKLWQCPVSSPHHLRLKYWIQFTSHTISHNCFMCCTDRSPGHPPLSVPDQKV